MTDDPLAPLRAMVTAYVSEIDRLKLEVAYLSKENAELWESVHELQDMNQRAREDA